MDCLQCGKPLVPGELKCRHCQASVDASALGLYAGFWHRVAAALVDGLLVLAAGMIVAGQTGASPWMPLLVLSWLYHALLESSTKQASLGKMALGIKVTSLEGERISFLRATLRHFGKIVSAALLLIGFLLAAFTARKQALHDMMARCLVVRASSTPTDAAEVDTTMPITGGVILLCLLVPIASAVANVFITTYHDREARARVAQAIRAAGPASDTPSASRYVSRVEGSKPSGRIEIFLDHAALGSRGIQPGASVRFTSTDGKTWRCSAQGVHAGLLPANCRP